MVKGYHTFSVENSITQHERLSCRRPDNHYYKFKRVEFLHSLPEYIIKLRRKANKKTASSFQQTYLSTVDYFFMKVCFRIIL